MGAATARPLKGSAVANNLGTTTTFGPIPVSGRRLSIIASWTGTPTGTFSLETSFDNNTWYTVPGAAAEFTANSQTQPAGASGSRLWNWYNVPGTMLRVRYTSTSGTGTLTVTAAFGD